MDYNSEQKLQTIEAELLASYTLGDIIDVPAIQKLMSDFFILTGFGNAIVDNFGKVLVANGWQEICTHFHRVNPETKAHCVLSDTELTSDIEAGKYKMYRCKNNMWDISTPIMVGPHKLGNLFLGQFFLEDETPPYLVFKEQAERYGFDQNAYLAALEKVPRWSRIDVDRAMAFYASLAQLISALSYKNVLLEMAFREKG